MFDRPPIDNIENKSTRSFTEIFLKTLAISVTTTAAAGHLNSLRCISRKDRAEAVTSVVFFLLLPILPLATLLYNIYHCFRSGGGDLSFKLSIVLGMRATPIRSEEGDVSIPLSELQFTNVQRVSKEYDLEWMGRMVLLVGCEVQAVATVVLVVRRMLHSAAASWDLFDGLMALGGAITELVSIGILLLNYKWECFELGPHEASERTTQAQHYLLDWLPLIPDSIVSQITLACSIIMFIPVKGIFKGIKSVASSGGWGWLSAIEMGAVYIFMLFPFPLTGNFLRGVWKFFPFSLQNLKIFDIWKIGYVCVIAGYFLISGACNDVTDMRISKADGLWKEIMWVDPLAEKLYVF